MGRTQPQYDRLRLNSGQHRRILLVMLVMGLLAFVPVGLRLYQLMIEEYDYYSAQALRNQTRTTSVTAHRGDILDRNMNILATSVSVENVYLDPHRAEAVQGGHRIPFPDFGGAAGSGPGLDCPEGGGIQTALPADRHPD